MDFLHTQIGIVLENIKRAYASGYPIVYIPTNQDELINELFFSQRCRNQVIPGLTINQNINSENQFSKCVYSLCGGDSFIPDNYRINESIRFDIKKTITEIPYLFVNFGSWDSSNPRYFGNDASTIIAKRYLPKFAGKYVSMEEKKAASLSLFVTVTPTQESIPPEFSQYIKIIEVPPISDDEINDIITSFLREYEIPITTVGRQRLDELTVQLRGFSCLRIQTLLKSMIINGDLTKESAKWKQIKEAIYQSKKEVLSNSKGLKWEEKEGQDAVGLSNTEMWLSNRSPLFEDTSLSLSHGHEIPKGILLSGIPGSGKSLMAKETARILNLPLISLDMGAIRGGVVGESEHNMINELKMAEYMAPCVLWIDEIEKAFSGSNSSSGDSGVSQRLFGKFLTWLQEKRSACFVFATSNDITSLPPEFFRSERFDRKFYTFLPTVEECAEIIVSYIVASNSRYIRKPGEPRLQFDPDLTTKTIWIDLLNQVCATETEFKNISLCLNSASDKTSHKTDTWLWKGTTKPKVKIFNGADISAIIKESKFLVRMKNQEVGNYDIAVRSDYRFGKEEFVEAVRSVILGGALKTESKSDMNATVMANEFKPYGETNQKDIAKCFIKLSENQFQPASGHELVSLSRYDREECKYELPDGWSLDTISTQRYNKVLFSLIVGAINQYAKDISQNIRV